MSTPREALAPLTAELVRAARADADALTARAGQEAAALLDDAAKQAQACLDTARAEGAEQAAASVTAERVRTRRAARRMVLTAQREALDELRRAVRPAALALREDPAYPDLLRRLRAQVRDLGVDHLTEHRDGGIVGQTTGRRVDASLPTLAERAVDALGTEVESLWLP